MIETHSDDGEEASDNDCAEKRSTSKEAFHCLQTAVKWLAQQEERDAGKLLSLKRVTTFLPLGSQEEKEFDSQAKTPQKTLYGISSISR
ncbi:hypothetical protein AVEN_189235-1 [Araneus ventricosus]|uniref:Uncharacterized protein n=1 Tax=Araneus ventricosus TaxID=182803 RepID=A0A4Y2W4P7_ARAVE|nr:hypothetical protein AVEN_43328-1 [Araneus ventricosus]GBO30921.1 hypothetical protein AVEN_189235-1 [Araneus ventricosus]